MQAVPEEFLNSYIETALWSSTSDNDIPLDRFGKKKIAAETLEKMKADCTKFFVQNYPLIEHSLERAGHDFWLTRNGHGAGFWDGDWPEPDATTLTEACKAFGEVYLYVGDYLIYRVNYELCCCR